MFNPLAFRQRCQQHLESPRLIILNTLNTGTEDKQMVITGWSIDQHLAGQLECVQVNYIIDKRVADMYTVEGTK